VTRTLRGRKRAVDHAAAVSVFQRFGELADEVEALIESEPVASCAR